MVFAKNLYRLDNFQLNGSAKHFSSRKIFRVLNEKFFKNLFKVEVKILIFYSIFLRLKFPARFYSGLSFASHWCPIGFYRTSLTLLIQEKRSAENGQNWNFFDDFFSKIFFLIGFYQKPPLLGALNFWRQPIHIMSKVNTCQILTILEKKSKITKNCQK